LVLSPNIQGWDKCPFQSPRQARSQVLRFGGEKEIFKGEMFFIIISFNKTFKDKTKLARHKKIVALPPNTLHAAMDLPCGSPSKQLNITL